MGTVNNLFSGGSQRFWVPSPRLDRQGFFPSTLDSRDLREFRDTAATPATDNSNAAVSAATSSMPGENHDPGFLAKFGLAGSTKIEADSGQAPVYVDPITRRMSPQPGNILTLGTSVFHRRYEEFAAAKWPNPFEAIKRGIASLGVCPTEEDRAKLGQEPCPDSVTAGGAFKWLRWFLMGEALMFWGMLGYQYTTCTQRHECHRLINTMRNAQDMPKLLFWLTTSSVFGGTAVVLSSLTEKFLAILAAGLDKLMCNTAETNTFLRSDEPISSTSPNMSVMRDANALRNAWEMHHPTSGILENNRMMPPSNPCGGPVFNQQEYFEHCVHCPNARERFYDDSNCVCNQQVQQQQHLQDSRSATPDDDRSDFRRYLEDLQEFIRQNENANGLQLKASSSSFWPRRLLREDLENFLKSESSSSFELKGIDSSKEARLRPQHLPSFITGPLNELSKLENIERSKERPTAAIIVCPLSESANEPIIEPWHGFDYKPTKVRSNGEIIKECESKDVIDNKALEVQKQEFEEEDSGKNSPETSEIHKKEAATFAKESDFIEKPLTSLLTYEPSPVYEDKLLNAERFCPDFRVIAGSNDVDDLMEEQGSLTEFEQGLRKRLIQYAAAYWVFTIILHFHCTESSKGDWFSKPVANPVCEVIFGNLWIILGLPAIFGTSFVAITVYDLAIPHIHNTYQNREHYFQALLDKYQSIRDTLRLRVEQAASNFIREHPANNNNNSDTPSAVLRRIANRSGLHNFRAGNEIPGSTAFEQPHFQKFSLVPSATNADPFATGISNNTLIVAVPGRANSDALPLQCTATGATISGETQRKEREVSPEADDDELRSLASVGSAALVKNKLVVKFTSRNNNNSNNNKVKQAPLIEEPDLTRSVRNSINLRTSKRSPTHIVPLVFSSTPENRLRLTRSLPGDSILSTNNNKPSIAVIPSFTTFELTPANQDTFKTSPTSLKNISIRSPAAAVVKQHHEPSDFRVPKFEPVAPTKSHSHTGCKRLQKLMELKNLLNPRRRTRRFPSLPKPWSKRTNSD
ncbi:unnamed protein product [Notodromas monacha]|uniref:Uncharacterized protein n=1 Tax=Notodromas monacha TaxID=399045 RepID=A0A7R9BJB3_9CRUS|nr:unnamed protein product [Notodromas monacha]CAG0916523.1 unnamed protein product [Notodromas monacha]